MARLKSLLMPGDKAFSSSGFWTFCQAKLPGSGYKREERSYGKVLQATISGSEK